MREDLLPESRTWLKEEIMGAKSSRDWLSSMFSRSNREIKGTQYKLNINPIYWLKKERKWGLGDKSTE